MAWSWQSSSCLCHHPAPQRGRNRASLAGTLYHGLRICIKNTSVTPFHTTTIKMHILSNENYILLWQKHCDMNDITIFTIQRETPTGMPKELRSKCTLTVKCDIFGSFPTLLLLCTHLVCAKWSRISHKVWLELNVSWSLEPLSNCKAILT